jgi:uncharacterized protein YcbX
MPYATISGLTIYPVKSMRGIELERAGLTPHGLEHDRRFMVVRSNGRFQTQRDLPRLALVQTRIADDAVVLTMAGHGSISIPFHATEGETVQTRVWGDECETIDLGEDISRWITSALDSEDTLRLVCMAPGFVRPQGKPEEMGEETHTHFADAAPFLVASESSLDSLNRELETRGYDKVPMNRFRPNIVLSDLEAFAEHRISRLRSDHYSLDFCHPCERCVVTTIDQSTAETDPDRQPFRTLRDINPVPGEKHAPAFGQNAKLASGDRQTISLGDRVEIFQPGD